MADTSWEYIIQGSGIYNDTSQDHEVISPDIGIVNEGAVVAAAGVVIFRRRMEGQ